MYKEFKSKVLGKKVEKLSNVNPVMRDWDDDKTKNFLSTMPTEEFEKLVDHARKNKDEQLLATLLSNWPFKDM